MNAYHSYPGFYFTFLLLMLSQFCHGDIHLLKEQNNYSVADMRGYTQQVIISGYATDDNTYAVFFNEMERVTDMEFYTSYDNSTWDKQKIKNLVVEDASHSNFYNGLKKYNIPLLKKQYFKLSYTVKSNELKLLASMNIRNGFKTDSISHNVTITKPLMLSWAIPPADSIFTVSIDSTEDNTTSTYSFKSVIKKGEMMKEGCSKSIYCIVHSPENTPAMEMGNWFNGLFKPVDGITETTIAEINKITDGITDTLEITKRLFAYVKKSISYIDIEAGYGAWIPRKADAVLNARKGDCKDMANLIYQMLKYKNITAYLGIMPTLSHPDDFILPSLGCANHMICVASIDNKWYFLDATDNENFFELPSRHSQGRAVFCISSSSPFQLTVPVVAPEKNKIQNSLNFNITDSIISGTWDFEAYGFSAVEMLDYINGYSEKDIREYFSDYFNSMAPKLKIVNYKYDITKTGQVNCHVNFETTNYMISHAEGKNYLSLKFLPSLFSEAIREDDCRHIMYSTELNDYNVSFHFNGPVKLTKPYETKADERDMKYRINFHQENDKAILLHYSFENPYLEYNDQLFNCYNKIVSVITNSFNNLVIYE